MTKTKRKKPASEFPEMSQILEIEEIREAFYKALKAMSKKTKKNRVIPHDLTAALLHIAMDNEMAEAKDYTSPVDVAFFKISKLLGGIMAYRTIAVRMEKEDG